MVDGLRSRHPAALYLYQIVGHGLCQPGRAVLHAPHQDIGRGALEGQDGLTGGP